MILQKTIVLIDQGQIAESADWQKAYSAYRTAIDSIHFPEASGHLTLRKKRRIAETSQWQRNGVGYLRSAFLRNMVEVQGWRAESQINSEAIPGPEGAFFYPDFDSYTERNTSKFGGFDFITTINRLRVAIEWETGNISSSHRSINKLTLALKAGLIDAGILILPSRDLYEHLTDRIGNISELTPYLGLWSSFASQVKRGLLAISVVEHDHLTDDAEHPYLLTGKDGRAKEGKGKL